jgi:hypothetical protein
MDRLIYLYKRFIILWFSSLWLRLIIALLYICFVKWIFYKYYGSIIPYTITENLPANTEKPGISEISEIKNTPEPDDSFTPASDYYSYFPHNTEIPFIDIFSDNDIFANIIIDVLICENKPAFTIIENTLPKTIVTEPPILDNNLPFEIPTNIVVSDDQLIKYIKETPLQKDYLNTIYGPSYCGPIIHSTDNMFYFTQQLLTDTCNHVMQKLPRDNDHVHEIVHKFIRSYMIQHDIYSTLTVHNLQNTEHIINLLLYELVINSVFADEQSQFISHSICRAIITEVIHSIEFTPVVDNNNNFEEILPLMDISRVQEILERFIPRSDDDLFIS